MIRKILQQFDLHGKVTGFEPFGNGHINWTYKVDIENGESFVLQRINVFVFNDPVGLMRNIDLLTKFMAEKVKDQREVLQLVKARNGNNFIVNEEGHYWRVYVFVKNSICYDKTPSTELFQECGAAFGRFQRSLADFPVSELIETIPNFHNTVARYSAFDAALNEDPLNRAKDVRTEIDFANAERPIANLFMDKIANQEVPLRVTHNDTKINNVLFDKDTHRGLCVVDLDTTMPGLAAWDFGDAIRYGANTGAEDEQDLDKISLDLNLFQAFAKGFCGKCKDYVTRPEIELCPAAAKLMTLETGLRFLTDYLNGDTYFKIAHPGHNVDRCRTQFKLVSDMNTKMDQMNAIIEKILQE